jgi:succinoglycan biosynthesis transport protein ExoP
MAEPGAEPTLRGYLCVLSRRRWWVAAISLLGLGVSLVLSLTATNQYTATAQLLVQSVGSINSSTSPAAYLITSAEVQTELQLVTSAQVQKQVRAQLGSAPGVSALEVGQTNVIAVTAVSVDPARAARIANAYARAFVAWTTATTISNLAAAESQLNTQINAIGKEIKRLPSNSAAQSAALSNQQAVLKGQLAQLQVAGATASTGLELVTPATVPISPSSPKPTQDALLGLIAGFALGIGAAFLRDNLDDTLTSGDAVEGVSGVPVLATVPMVPSWRKKANPVVIAVSNPTSQPAEAYRSLRTSLQFVRQDRPMRSILVTSPSAGDGKTATVVNLGAVFAQTGARVVLVSCDLRRPGLSQFFVPDEHAELSAVLAGKQPLERAVTPVAGVEGLWTLGTRSIAANPTELLGGKRMQSVFARLAEQFDIVLIDSPPVLPVADAMILSGYADAVLLVVAAGQTRRAELRHTVDKLAQAGALVVGAVLNKATSSDEYGYYGRYQPYVLPEDAALDGPRRPKTGATSRTASRRRPSGRGDTDANPARPAEPRPAGWADSVTDGY